MISRSSSLIIKSHQIVRGIHQGSSSALAQSVFQKPEEDEYPWWGPEPRKYEGSSELVEQQQAAVPALLRVSEKDEQIMVAREKEMGDWRALTLDQKRLIYRYSFPITLAEEDAKKGYWKPVLALMMFCTALALGLFSLFNRFVLSRRPDPNSPQYLVNSRNYVFTRHDLFTGKLTPWDEKS